MHIAIVRGRDGGRRDLHPAMRQRCAVCMQRTWPLDTAVHAFKLSSLLPDADVQELLELLASGWGAD